MKYRVSFNGYASYTTDVEAEDVEGAIELAYEEAPTLCAHCSGWNSWQASLDLGDEWDVSAVYDENDNEVYNEET